MAADGVAAENYLREHPVDVVLSDLIMPHMDGHALLLAAHRIAPGVPVVVMSAFGNVEQAVQAMREGARDFLVKPVKRAEVLAAVARAAELSALRSTRPAEDLLRATLGQTPMGEGSQAELAHQELARTDCARHPGEPDVSR